MSKEFRNDMRERQLLTFTHRMQLLLLRCRAHERVHPRRAVRLRAEADHGETAWKRGVSVCLESRKNFSEKRGMVSANEGMMSATEGMIVPTKAW